MFGLHTLKNHPFAVEAFFSSSLVLTYAVAKEELQNYLPPCLTLDTYADQWAFVAVAMVQTKHLRPKGLPAWMGNDFFLTGYRIFVRYTTKEGKRLRGLYILKSETDSKKMEFLGNFFTHYQYTTTDIRLQTTVNHVKIQSAQSALDIEVILHQPNTPLPVTSPFLDWKEARRFAGPLPFTFTYNAENQQVLIIEGVRENWTPTPVEVIKHQVGFLGKQNFKTIRLANAFVIENIPYFWKKGRID